MDTRGWEQAQPRRSSLKRPWDEEETVLSARPDAWNGVILPPIDPAPFRGPLMPLASAELSTKTYPGYAHEPQEVAAKRPKYEENDTPLLVPPRTTFLDSSSFAPPHKGESSPGGARAGDKYAQNISQLCPRCRRLTTQSSDLERESRHESRHEMCDSMKNPALALVTQLAAEELTKALRTLATGVSSARGATICRESIEHQPEYLHNSPPIGEQGLKQTLDWLVGKLAVVNQLADKLVRHVQSPYPQHLDRNSPQNDTAAQDALHYSMKRHLDGDPSGYRPKGDGAEPTADSQIFKRRRSILANPNPEDPASVKTYNEYRSPHSSMDGPNRRSAIMNPPPAPVRQLPSSPGRSLPSPTSMSFPSPLAAPYGGGSQSMAGLPSGSQASPGAHYLPPIGSAHYSDSAIHAHAASLQHEISVQKIALSSLQGEHDKLLAAYSRSQTRACALETKHAVSDNEIVIVSEEKARLQTQVADLERDIEDLTRSRNEARQSAVLEGAQYVEIVRKASQLEKITARERKSWSRLKEKMEQRISLLGGETEFSDSGGLSPAAGVRQSETPASPIDGPTPEGIIGFAAATGVKGSRSAGANSSPSNSAQQDFIEDLQSKIGKWRSRCEEVEATLRAVREESRSMEGIIQTLGLVGKSMLERADKALGDVRAPTTG